MCRSLGRRSESFNARTSASSSGGDSNGSEPMQMARIAFHFMLHIVLSLLPHACEFSIQITAFNSTTPTLATLPRLIVLLGRHTIGPRAGDCSRFDDLKQRSTRITIPAISSILYAGFFAAPLVFEERGIQYTTKISAHDSGAFVKDVIRYAASIEADLISIMNFHENSLMGILGTSYEQQIITNEAEIPVLVLNPFETRIIRQTPFSF